MRAREVQLPHGRVGVVFRGAPPSVGMIHEDSPMKGMLQEGEYVQALLVPDFGLEVNNFDNCKVLVDYLKRFPNTRRGLFLAQEPVTDIPLTIKVVIPPGKIGISFEGDSNPIIKKIAKESPLNDLVDVGDMLQGILIPGHPERYGVNMNASDAVSVLLENAALEGRTLVFTKPLQPPVPPSPSPVTVAENLYHHAPPNLMPQYIDSVLEAKIEGLEQQLITFTLNPGQKVRAESGTMLYMTQHIHMKTKTAGQGFRRWVTGSSVFMTEFTCGSKHTGTVTFAPPFPSKIIPLKLEDYGGKITCQHGSFLCSETTVDITIEFAQSFGGAFFGGEGIVLQGMTGSGRVYVHARGMVVKKFLQRGEILKCSTGALLAFEQGVKYNIEAIGGFNNVFFGGEGLFITTLTGPGTVWLEGSPMDRIVREIAKRLPTA